VLQPEIIMMNQGDGDDSTMRLHEVVDDDDDDDGEDDDGDE